MMLTLESMSTGRVETDPKLAPGSRYVNKPLPPTTGRWQAESAATVSYLVEKPTWLSSWSRDYSSNYVLAYRYQVEVKDGEEDSNGDAGADSISSDGKMVSRASLKHLAGSHPHIGRICRSQLAKPASTRRPCRQIRRRYSTIFRWELILVWELLRQIAKTRFKMRGLISACLKNLHEDTSRPDWRRLDRWTTSVSNEHLSFKVSPTFNAAADAQPIVTDC